MKTLIKVLVIALVALFAKSAAAADLTVVSSISATTPATILTGGKYVVTQIKFLNSSASSNVATVKFYDSASNDTNYVQAAYTSYSLISTNYATTFTNAAGIVVTNTFSGVYTLATANAASTNERPSLFGPLAMPYNTWTTVPNISIEPNVGLTIYSTQAGTLETTYRKITP